jgi:hypothetical protein
MPDALEKLGESIPSVYYDLIARVVPGGALIALIALTEPDVSALFERLEPLAGTLVAVAVSYLAGILLTPLGSLLFEAPVLVASRGYAPARQFAADRLWPVIDRIGHRNAALAGTLAKMAAEVTLCQNLMAGTVISLASTRLRDAVARRDGFCGYYLYCLARYFAPWYFIDVHRPLVRHTVSVRRLRTTLRFRSPVLERRPRQSRATAGHRCKTLLRVTTKTPANLRVRRGTWVHIRPGT